MPVNSQGAPSQQFALNLRKHFGLRLLNNTETDNTWGTLGDSLCAFRIVRWPLTFLGYHLKKKCSFKVNVGLQLRRWHNLGKKKKVDH